MCKTWGPLPAESKVNDALCEQVISMDQFLSGNELLHTIFKLRSNVQ